MKKFSVKQIIVLAVAIGVFATWTPAASDNSTVHLVLTAILTCDDSAPGSVISNGHRLQGTSPCQAPATLLADTSKPGGSTGPDNVLQKAGSSAARETARALGSAASVIDATSISTPDGALLLAFERGEVEVIIVVVCPAN
jgi:hypothetical protein